MLTSKINKVSIKASKSEFQSTGIAAKQASYYDLTALNEMSAGNKDFIISLIRIFLDTIPVNSGEMVVACNEGNWDMVSKLAHKLKSTIDMMRMTAITQEIRTIELDGKNKVNTDELPALVYKVDDVIKAASQQLRDEFNL